MYRGLVAKHIYMYNIIIHVKTFSRMGLRYFQGV